MVGVTTLSERKILLRVGTHSARERSSFQISLFGFVYQVRQDDFKSMPRWELALLRGWASEHSHLQKMSSYR